MNENQPNRNEADIERRDRDEGAHEGRSTRGSHEGDPKADERMPGREFGAGGQVDDGPHSTSKPTPRGAH